MLSTCAKAVQVCNHIIKLVINKPAENENLLYVLIVLEPVSKDIASKKEINNQ